MAQVRHTEARRALVIIEWKAGASLNQLVKDFGLPKTTIRRWLEGQERVTAPVPKPAPAPKTKDLTGPVRSPGQMDDILDQLSWQLVEASFGATTAIGRLATDPTWARQQNAHDLAILFGVLVDKLARVLASRSGTVALPTPIREEHDGGDSAG